VKMCSFDRWKHENSRQVRHEFNRKQLVAGTKSSWWFPPLNNSCKTSITQPNTCGTQTKTRTSFAHSSVPTSPPSELSTPFISSENWQLHVTTCYQNVGQKRNKERDRRNQTVRVKDHVEVHVYVLSASVSKHNFFLCYLTGFSFSVCFWSRCEYDSVILHFHRLPVSDSIMVFGRLEAKVNVHVVSKHPHCRDPFFLCQQRDKDKSERLSDKSFWFMCEHVLMTYWCRVVKTSCNRCVPSGVFYSFGMWIASEKRRKNKQSKVAVFATANVYGKSFAFDLEIVVV
jgi:hypothetical protein